MILTSPTAWLAMLAMMLLASAAGVAVARLWNWQASRGVYAVVLWWGLSLAPFLLGLATVLVLWLLPTVSHAVHLMTVAGLLVLVTLVAWKAGQPRPLAMATDKWGKLEQVLCVLVFTWCAGLLANTIFLPLSQNDSLEYATVGRILFHARTLSAYPAIHPELTDSGFYGPWTHPPLYVALIYIVSVIQGHADAPGLMRLIAPWSLIVATGLVYALGATVRRIVGLLAALIFMGAPLLFLGADAALLDSLPVLGLTLVIAAMVFVQGTTRSRGVAAGCALGLALWSHSQAVLFVPMAGAALIMQHGWRQWRAWLSEVAFMVSVAMLLAAWPYIRNLNLFGTPISDNPAGFSLPQLGWADYFSIGRGINSWPTIVQYGWLKGWFAIEAFGLAFWFMLVGLLVLVVARRRHEPVTPLLKMATVIVCCYLLGVMISTLFGLDLMIKNERYMLVVLPFVVLIAAFGIARLLAARPKVAAPIALLLCSVYAAELIGLVSYRYLGNGLTLSTLGRSFEETQQNRPEYLVVDYLRKHTEPNALVFSLKPADMYYSQRRMISYLDPHLLPFYKEHDPARALALLRSLGILYVHVPDYGLPPFYNSALAAILRNPQWARLAYQADGYQVYALESAQLREGPRQDLLSAPNLWSQSTTLILGGRKSLANLVNPPMPVEPGATYHSGPPLGLFNRDWSTLLTAGSLAIGSRITVEGGREYALDLQLQGRGLVRVGLQQFDISGAPLRDAFLRSRSQIQLTDLILSRSHPSCSFSRRLRMLPGARYVVLTLEQVGVSELQVQRARLVLLSHSND